MLLFDIEKHVEPLSNAEKKQLIRYIQQILKEDISTIEGWKFHLDYNLTEMYETAKSLRAFAATLLVQNTFRNTQNKGFSLTMHLQTTRSSNCLKQWLMEHRR